MAAKETMGFAPGTGAPAGSAFAITPADATDFPFMTRFIWVGGAGGTLTVVMLDGSVVQFSGIPVGTMLPIRARGVNATGTAATLLVGLY